MTTPIDADDLLAMRRAISNSPRGPSGAPSPSGGAAVKGRQDAILSAQPIPAALGTARTHDELVDLLAARREALGLSNAFIDHRWDYAPGMTDKYLGPTRIKTLGRQSMDDLLQVLGVSLVLVEDMGKVRQEADKWEQRKPGYAHSPRISRKSIERAKPVIFSEMGTKSGAKRNAQLTVWCASKIGRKGGRATARKRTKEQRSQAARKAAIARWRKPKGAILLTTKHQNDHKSRRFANA